MTATAEAAAPGIQGTLVTPDFTEVKDNVEPGIYKTRIVDSKVDKWEGKDGKKDTYFINWTLETYAETEEKNNGRKIFHRTPINGPGAFRLRDFFKAAIGEECPATGFDRTMLHGREVEVTVAPQKDRPEYNEVKTVKGISLQQ